MKVIFDNCMPEAFLDMFSAHEAKHARQMGWDTLAHGHLLKSANDEGFDVLVTIDRRMPFQSSLRGLRLCVAVIEGAENSKTKMAKAVAQILERIESMEPGLFHVFQASDID